MHEVYFKIFDSIIFIITIIIPDRNSKKQFNEKQIATGWTKYKYKFYKYI